MKLFQVEALVVGSILFDVEAPDLDTARELAANHVYDDEFIDGAFVDHVVSVEEVDE